MIDVSISIVNFNAKEYLANCIGSIIKSIKDHSYEMIVVDNGSTDGSANIAKQFPQIEFIQNSKNLGFIKANNMGMKASAGKHILSLNNDALVLDGAIDRLLAFMDAHPDAGAVGPKLLNSDRSIQMQCRRSFPRLLNSLGYFLGLSRLFPRSRMFSSYLMAHIKDDVPMEVDSLCGAAMLVRREVIDQVGLMDESYFMYGDDIDWCYRIKQAGWKIYYLPQAEMIHFGGMGGSRKNSYRNIFEFHRAMAIFHKKHYSGQYLFLINWLVYTGIWIKFFLAFVQNFFRKEKFVGTKKP